MTKLGIKPGLPDSVVELRGGGLAPTLYAGPLLVFKVEALGASLGLPISVEKRDSVFGSDGSRQIIQITGDHWSKRHT